MSGILPSGLRLVAGKLKDIASDIVTVRTGTVVSDYASMSQTLVTLDNDPEQASVQALALNGALPSGARVLLIAYPPRGLVIVGSMDQIEPTDVPWRTLTGGPTLVQRPADTSLSYIWMEAQGGGGAGGGAAITPAGQSSIGAGGAAGMWVASIFTIADLTWPINAFGGAGGAGVSGLGGNSGTASWVQHSPGGVPTDLLRAPGGAGGGTLAAAVTVGAGIDGASGVGVGFVGQRLAFGGDGQTVTRLIAAGPNLSGHGGASYFGGGGRASQNNANGGNAAVLGAGGGGASNPASSTAQTGGSGQIGAVYYRFF